MKEELSKIYDKINYWVAFAEAKNASICLLTSTFIISIMSLLKDDQLHKPTYIVLVLVVIILGLSLLVSLMSFFPRLGKIKNMNNYVKQYNLDNIILIYFNDIASIKDEKTYLKLLYEKFGENLDNNNLDKIEMEYSREILFNAVIAKEKYKKFRISLILLLIAVILMLLAVILWSVNILK